MGNVHSAVYTSVAVNIPAGASTAIVAAPAAGKQIWVFGFIGGADATGTIKFEDEDNAALSGIMPALADSPFVMPITPFPEIPWLKCTTAKALHIVTVTCTFDGIIIHATIDV